MSEPDPELWEAVEKACVADAAKFVDVEQQMLLTSFIVVAARSGFDEEGESVTQVHVLPDRRNPAYVMDGLLREAQIKLEADMLGDYRDML